MKASSYSYRSCWKKVFVGWYSRLGLGEGCIGEGSGRGWLGRSRVDIGRSGHGRLEGWLAGRLPRLLCGRVGK